MRLAIMVLTLLLAACVAPRQLTIKETAQQEPIRCLSKKECDLYWQRAQVWVAQNSEWRIQTATDVIIETYGPGNSKTTLAFRIYREPVSDGSFLISFWAGCDNIFGCSPRPVDAIANLRSYIFNGALPGR